MPQDASGEHSDGTDAVTRLEENIRETEALLDSALEGLETVECFDTYHPEGIRDAAITLRQEIEDIKGTIATDDETVKASDTVKARAELADELVSIYFRYCELEVEEELEILRDRYGAVEDVVDGFGREVGDIENQIDAVERFVEARKHRMAVESDRYSISLAESAFTELEQMVRSESESDFVDLVQRELEAVGDNREIEVADDAKGALSRAIEERREAYRMELGRERAEEIVQVVQDREDDVCLGVGGDELDELLGEEGYTEVERRVESSLRGIGDVSETDRLLELFETHGWSVRSVLDSGDLSEDEVVEDLCTLLNSGEISDIEVVPDG